MTQEWEDSPEAAQMRDEMERDAGDPDFTVGVPDWFDKLKGSGIPDYMHGGLARYFAHGLPPGSFLTAVLANDLHEACARADDTNKHRLFDYVAWLYQRAPIGSWGSEAAVESWIARHNKARAGGLASGSDT